MYSLNVPVPDEVSRLVAGLGTTVAADVRTRQTLVVKRLGDGPHPELARRVRAALEGTPPFAARVAGVETFEDPASGRGPVVYLAVESPGLVALHERLCESFDPVEGIEGPDYVPHVTVARGPDARALRSATVSPVEWTVERLVVWDADHREPVESVALPA